MFEKFVMMLVQAGFSIVGTPMIFSVSFRGREGTLETVVADDGTVAISVNGAPHNEMAEGKGLLQLISEMESSGHTLKPVSGNQFIVYNGEIGLAGEFLVAPEKGGGHIALQACSASPEFKATCEAAEVPVKDFSSEEVAECANSSSVPHRAHECCW